MRDVRPVRYRWKALGWILLVTVPLISATDCYHFDDQRFAEVYLSAAGGEIKVSLRGSYSRNDRVLGSHYDLMVSYLSPDSAFERAELVSVSIRGVDGRDPVAVHVDSAEHLRRVQPGSYYWKSADTPLAGDNFAVGFLMQQVPLEYRGKVVTGRLRLIGSRGVREVPFTATLRTQHDRELRSRFWDVLMSV